jgi:hypothetical protein
MVMVIRTSTRRGFDPPLLAYVRGEPGNPADNSFVHAQPVLRTEYISSFSPRKSGARDRGDLLASIASSMGAFVAASPMGEVIFGPFGCLQPSALLHEQVFKAPPGQALEERPKWQFLQGQTRCGQKPARVKKGG